jgi:hypothetical protein
MSRPMRTRYLKAVAAFAVGATLVACGKSAQDASVTHIGHQNKSGSAGVVKGANAPDPDLVNAVSAAGNSTTPISMKFKLTGRPTVTTPLQLLISVTPSPEVAISHILVSFQPGDGLQLQSDRTLEVSDPSPGTPIQQELTLIPQQNGVLSLSATVLVDTESGSISRTYSIPLIATDSHT